MKLAANSADLDCPRRERGLYVRQRGCHRGAVNVSGHGGGEGAGALCREGDRGWRVGGGGGGGWV